MKNLIFPLLFFSVGLNAQIDPNAEVKAMGLEVDYIGTLCHIAYNDGTDVNGVPSMFDFWILLEDLDPSEMTWAEMKPILKELWDTKYSKCHCNDQNAITGSLDYVASYARKERWVKLLYNPQSIGANVNRITWLDHRINYKGTLIDNLINLSSQESTDYNINDNEVFRQDIIGMTNILREYGAKHMAEMTPEEIELNSK
ncbi:MAG: hypothetical protein RIA63_05185 [Cyclobacteriaceae bacterium]